MSSTNPSTSFSTTTIIAVASTAALLYIQWKNLPQWMKLGWGRTQDSDERQQQGKARGDGIDEDANDRLATLPVVLDKLSEMMDLLKKTNGDSSRSPESELTTYDLMAACYSLFHLYQEIFTKDPDYRDKQYDDIRKDDDVKVEEVRELAEYLDYAHWAYLSSHTDLARNCKQAGMDLMSQDTATEPGRVAHYVACKHHEKLVIVGLKGTSTFSDVLTDLIAIPKEHVGCYFDDRTFAAPKAEGERGLADAAAMFCHEGIYTAAIWMADRLQPMLENLFVPLHYRVVLCGHSLGAGTACLLGLELRSRIAAFRRNYTDLRVLAFATPPVVSYNASKACAPFVTSMVNNADVITRCSVANLAVMDKLLMRVHERLVARGLRVDSLKSLMKYYEEHAVVDGENLLLTEEELDAFFEETHAATLDDEREALFVPGRIVVMWNKGENDNFEMGGIVTDCGMKMLRQIELSSTMVTDHLVKFGYRPNICRLLAKLENAK